MRAAAVHRLRRAAAGLGLTPVAVVPPPYDARLEEIETHPARLVEDAELTMHSVGDAEAWREPVAFLDGVQRYGIFAYDGCSPVAWATIAAAVRERRDRKFRTGTAIRRQLLVGRAEVLERLASVAEDADLLPIPDDIPLHPHREMQAIRRVVDTARGRLELEAGSDWRRRDDGWLLVDGSLGVSSSWARDPRMLGIIKSHASLPFEHDDLARYLRLPLAHRTSVFAPDTSTYSPVYSWALRLWEPDGLDVFHGLVRVEAAATERTLEEVAQVARHLLAERSPLSTPDGRWDRLLYGFHDVERFLKAGGGAPAPLEAATLPGS